MIIDPPNEFSTIEDWLDFLKEMLAIDLSKLSDGDKEEVKVNIDLAKQFIAGSKT